MLYIHIHLRVIAKKIYLFIIFNLIVKKQLTLNVSKWRIPSLLSLLISFGKFKTDSSRAHSRRSTSNEPLETQTNSAGWPIGNHWFDPPSIATVANCKGSTTKIN